MIVGHYVGDLVVIDELKSRISELEALLETPAERAASLPVRQARWDADLADFTDLKARGYVVDFKMPYPRPTV